MINKKLLTLTIVTTLLASNCLVGMKKSYFVEKNEKYWNKITPSEIVKINIKNNTLDLSETEVTHTGLNSIIASIIKLKKIKRLVLKKCQNIDFSKVNWEKMGELDYLDLSYIDLYFNDIEAILKKNNQIKTLNLSHCNNISYDDTSRLIHTYSKMPSIGPQIGSIAIITHDTQENHTKNAYQKK